MTRADRRFTVSLAVPLAAAIAFGCAACGNKSSGPCGSSKQHGAAPPDGNILWCSDGDGKKHGVFREWWPSGKPKIEARYEHGVQHGPTVIYHEDGTKKEAGNYAKGLRRGQWKEWYPDGKLKRDALYGDDDVVTWTLYAEETGTKWIEGAYKHQREHGKFAEYYAGGQKMAEGEYIDGEKVGVFQYWNEDGTPSEIELGSFAETAFGAE